MLYLLTSLLASLIGAISGIGGGVIIKPMLDLIGDYPARTISVLSAFTVLSMSAASLGRHFLYRTKINFRIGILLSLGAVFGGIAGSYLFSLLLGSWKHTGAVTLLQNALLTILLAGVLVYMNLFRKKRTFLLHSPVAIFIIGLSLGMISSFLGIGGGPVNMVVLTLLFSMNTKQAVVNSLLLIFFSQASKLIAVSLSTDLACYDLSVLWVMIPAAIIGGLIGAWLNNKLSSSKILQLFTLTTLVIIGISIFNSTRILVEYL